MPRTIAIPGGHAVLRDRLTVGGRRVVQVAMGRLRPDTIEALIRLAIAAEAVQQPNAGQEDYARLQAAQDAYEALPDAIQEQMLALPDATIYALLESWTIPLPLPRCVADIAEWPTDVYDAIWSEAQARQGDVVADAAGGGFEVDSVEDPDSPTGASVASIGRSTAVARTQRAPSGKKRRRGSRNTGTGGRSQ